MIPSHHPCRGGSEIAIIRKPDYQMSSIGVVSMPPRINLPRTGGRNVNIFGQQNRFPSFPGSNRSPRQPVLPVGKRAAGGRIRVTPREVRQVVTGKVAGRGLPGRIERSEPRATVRTQRVRVARIPENAARIPATGYPVPNYEPLSAIVPEFRRVIPADVPQGAKKKAVGFYRAAIRALRLLFTIPDREDLKCQ